MIFMFELNENEFLDPNLGRYVEWFGNWTWWLDLYAQTLRWH